MAVPIGCTTNGDVTTFKIALVMKSPTVVYGDGKFSRISTYSTVDGLGRWLEVSTGAKDDTTQSPTHPRPDNPGTFAKVLAG